MPLWAEKEIISSGGYFGPTFTTPHLTPSNRLSSALLPCDLRDDATCTTRRCSFASFEAKLGNPSRTCFQAKQAARSRYVSHAIFILPSVLLCNWQTIPHFVLRPKSRKCCSDFVGQITKSQQLVLRPKSGNLMTLVLRSNQETPWPWFWDWTKKPTLLISLCSVQTTHSVTRSLNHPATEYPTCVWQSPVLYIKSPTPASILITVCHIAPVTYTSWDKQMCFSTQHK
jgi:hypothetical protein